MGKDEINLNEIEKQMKLYNELMYKYEDTLSKLREEEIKKECYEQKINELDIKIEHLIQKRNKIQKELNEYKKKKALILRSRSWRYTALLRKMKLALMFWRKSSGLKNVINNSEVKALERKLWGGFSKYAVNELEMIKQNPTADVQARVSAAWHLMRWHFYNQNYGSAIENLNFMNSIDPSNANDIKRVVSKAYLLNKLKKPYQAELIIKDAISFHGYHPDLYLALAMVETDENKRLEHINNIYKNAGLLLLEKKDENKSLSLSNLTAKGTVSYDLIQDEKVSIIIPVFNAESTISIALDSLLNQTWKNIEIIVVDDCSTDSTADVVENYAKIDNRVRLIRKTENQGAYAARNTGLKFVTGDYITVHDSDDWSHPQKIEQQVLALKSMNQYVAVITNWVRVKSDLVPVGSWLLKGSFFDINLSSLLFKRSVINDLGGWDFVRVSGDTEYYWRIKKFYGSKSILELNPQIPYSFSLVSETSLTRSSATHVRTHLFGLRRIYREGAMWWHKNSSSLYIDPNQNPRNAVRPFPCPRGNLPYKKEADHYDMVIVADFNLKGDIKNKTLQMIKLAAKKSKKIAIFHWRRYKLDVSKPLSSDVFDICYRYNIDILVPGDSITANELIIMDPKILSYKLDSVPKIKMERIIVINSDHKWEDTDELKRLFGMEGYWGGMK